MALHIEIVYVILNLYKFRSLLQQVIPMRKTQKQALSTKISKFFTLFCTKHQENQPETLNNKSQKRKSSRRVEKTIERRGTLALQLSTSFLRISRKNIVDEEFFADDIINLQIEKHLSCRIKNFGETVLINGEFTTQLYQSIPYPIKFTEEETSCVSSDAQLIFSSRLPKMKAGTIDVVLYQTMYSRSELTKKLNNMNKKSWDSEIKKYSYAELIQIMTIFNRFYESNYERIILIGSNRLSQDELSLRLSPFTDKYLFELERVKKNQELFCYIIFASKSPLFLKIDNKMIKQFVIDSLQIANQFQQELFASLLNRLIAHQSQNQNYIYQDIIYSLRALNLNREQKTNISFSKVTKSSNRVRQISVSTEHAPKQPNPSDLDLQKLKKTSSQNWVDHFLSILSERSVCNRKQIDNFRFRMSKEHAEERNSDDYETPYLLSLTPDFQK